MSGYNPENERVKKQYEEALLNGRDRAPRSVEKVWKAINLFEHYTGRSSFKSFSREQAKGQPLSLSTVRSTLASIKDFFSWLVMHPHYTKRIDGRGIDFLGLGRQRRYRWCRPC